MSIVLRLDLPGLLHVLETSGPEVRLEITNAIVAAAVKRHINKAAPQQIEFAIAAGVRELLAGLNNAKPTNNRAVQEFRLHVANVARASINDTITEAVDKLDIDKQIDARLDAEVERRIAAGVRTRIDGLMAAAAAGQA